MANFTKKAIEASFLKLLNERPLNKITVKDIVEDCGINRNSFYYHFDDIPSLMKGMIREEFEDIVSQYPGPDNLKKCVLSAIERVIKNKRAFLHIYNSTAREIIEQNLWEPCDHCVRAKTREKFGGNQVSEEDGALILNFYKSMVYGQISLWIAGGLKDDIVKVYNRLLELSDGMITEMFRRGQKPNK